MKISDLKKFVWVRYTAQRATNIKTGTKGFKLQQKDLYGYQAVNSKRDRVMLLDGSTFTIDSSVTDKLLAKSDDFKGQVSTIKAQMDKLQAQTAPAAPKRRTAKAAPAKNAKPASARAKKITVPLTTSPAVVRGDLIQGAPAKARLVLPKADLALKHGGKLKHDPHEDEQEEILEKQGVRKLSGAPAFEYDDLPEELQHDMMRRSYSSVGHRRVKVMLRRPK